MATSQAKRVIMVGCGGIAGCWLPTLTKMRDAKLVGLVDLNRKAAEKRAAEYDLDPTMVFDSLKEAVKTTKAEVVCDVTIPMAHPKVTIEALKLGCDVLGEKPMAESLADARKMVKTAQTAGRTYAVMQNRRWLPSTRAVQQFIANGKLGQLEEIHCDFFRGPHFGGFREQMEFPLLIDMAIHTFDAARCMSGADPESVYCYSYNPGRSWYDHDANAIVIFEMSDGMVYTYRGSWCAEGMETTWESTWRFMGDKGTLTNTGEDVQAEVLAGHSNGKTLETKPTNVRLPKVEHTGHAGCIRHFFASLKKGETPETHCEDNIKSLAMVLAAVKSARSGKREKVVW